jgi:CubicO group peptidase (beta-lactamase class C family)
MAIDGPPMQRDSISRTASMTKPMTAVAAMILVEERKLSLQKAVDTVIPELADRPKSKSSPGGSGIQSRFAVGRG